MTDESESPIDDEYRAEHQRLLAKWRGESRAYEYKIIRGELPLARTWYGALYVLAVGFAKWHTIEGYRLWALSAKWHLNTENER